MKIFLLINLLLCFSKGAQFSLSIVKGAAIAERGLRRDYKFHPGKNVEHHTNRDNHSFYDLSNNTVHHGSCDIAQYAEVVVMNMAAEYVSDTHSFHTHTDKYKYEDHQYGNKPGKDGYCYEYYCNGKYDDRHAGYDEKYSKCHSDKYDCQGGYNIDKYGKGSEGSYNKHIYSEGGCNDPDIYGLAFRYKSDDGYAHYYDTIEYDIFPRLLSPLGSNVQDGSLISHPCSADDQYVHAPPSTSPIKIGVFLISLGLLLILIVSLLFACGIISCNLPSCFYACGIFCQKGMEASCQESAEQDLDTITLKRFTLKEVEDATQGFASRRLGGGGFGEVFEGKLLGKTVAVKRLKNHETNDFRSEVESMGTLNHVNLLHLEGFCAEGPHRLLVYEYMPNGSLDAWIFHPNKSLTWDTRLQIAKGVASCLLYLHEHCRDCILHLDIKPHNVLLDVKFCAKVCDFGMCELLHRDVNEAAASLAHARGTFGYMAPELCVEQVATPKADVYSFGMVLWELVNGGRVLEESTFRPTHALHEIQLGKWDEVIDPKIYREVEHDEMRLSQVKHMMRLAYWCIQHDPIERPAMSTVLHKLQSGEEVPEFESSLLHGLNWDDFNMGSTSTNEQVFTINMDFNCR